MKDKNQMILATIFITTFLILPTTLHAQTAGVEPTMTQTRNADGTTTQSVFQNNMLIEKIVVDQSGNPLQVQEFEDGNLILTRKIIYGGNGTPVKTQVWDEDSFLIAEEGHDESGILRMRKKYRIDGKVKSETRFSEEGKPVATHHYKYDKRDFAQREWKTTEHQEDGAYTEITYTDDGALWEVTDYDPRGLRLKSTWFNWDGTRTETIYDENGRPLRSERRNDEGAPMAVTRHDMEGDEKFI